MEKILIYRQVDTTLNIILQVIQEIKNLADKYQWAPKWWNLVDTLVSGTSGSNPMGLRVPPSGSVRVPFSGLIFGLLSRYLPNY